MKKNNQRFNCFRILEKDSKELIHSEFIKYLLQLDQFFVRNLFPKFTAEFDKESVKTEKSYNIDTGGNKKQRARVDIQAYAKDKKSILIIENKFKSFPYKAQLDLYDNLPLDKSVTTRTKYILCFDPTVIDFETNDWNKKSYADVLQVIESFLQSKPNISTEEESFIKQYYSFLKDDYCDPFITQMQSPGDLIAHHRKDNNKMWLRLLFSKLFIQFQSYFDELNGEFKYRVNPGNAAVPLINIEPQNWRIDGIELLIQFQGSDLKFYTHRPEKMKFDEYKRRLELIIKKFTDHQKSQSTSREGQLKKLPRGNYGSCFIFKENLQRTLRLEEVTTEEIYSYVLGFYHELNDFVEQYSTDH